MNQDNVIRNVFGAVENILFHACLLYDDGTLFVYEAEKCELMYTKLKDCASVAAKSMISRAENILSVGDSSKVKTVNTSQQPGNLETLYVGNHNRVEIVPTSVKSLQNTEHANELLGDNCKYKIDLFKAKPIATKTILAVAASSSRKDCSKRPPRVSVAIQRKSKLTENGYSQPCNSFLPNSSSYVLWLCPKNALHRVKWGCTICSGNTVDKRTLVSVFNTEEHNTDSDCTGKQVLESHTVEVRKDNENSIEKLMLAVEEDRHQKA